jgi:hypothetical protein
MARTTGRGAAKQVANYKNSPLLVELLPRPSEVIETDDGAAIVLLAAPCAVVRGRDGKTRWVAQCPRCVERGREGLIVGDDESRRAACKTCEARVEIRDIAHALTAPTMPPPED